MLDIAPGTPYLEHYPDGGGTPQRTAIDRLPFTIGRSETTSLRIDSTQVSREHAALVQVGGRFRVKDLGSTNGTFLNGQRIQEADLGNGDILHIASAEFTFHSGQPADRAGLVTQPLDPAQTRPAALSSPVAVQRAARRLQEVLLSQGFRLAYQPLLNLETSEAEAYEVVGGPGPSAVFCPADRSLPQGESHLADRLNQVLRLVALEESARLPNPRRLFLPVGNAEFGHESLLAALGTLVDRAPPDTQVVLEIEESSVSDTPYMQRLRELVSGAQLGLAYTGFSAGKARLAEWGRVQPDYLKLDKGFFQSGGSAKARQRQFREVLQAAESREIILIATGVDQDAALAACRDLGCPWGQGERLGAALPLLAYEHYVARAELVSS